MKTGLTKQEKTTDIWFDEKDPLIHIRTHNTDLKKRLAAYAGQHPDQCRQTDADPETGCMEFEKTVPAYAQQAAAMGVDLSVLTVPNFLLRNLLPVTIGNILGGAALAWLMWFVLLRGKKAA